MKLPCRILAIGSILLCTQLVFACSDWGKNSVDVYPRKGPVSERGYQAILATTDIAEGSNRFAFVLTSSQGFVMTGPVYVSIFELDSPLKKGTYKANSVEWPVQNRNMYVANLIAISKGKWNAVIEFPHNQGNQRVEIPFRVRDKPIAPGVGEFAPVVNSKTLDDVDDMSELSTGTIEQLELYRRSIAEVLQSDRPSVISFSSPAFCRNEVCGPQVQVIAELYDKKNGSVFFVHSDVYDNPKEIKGNLDVGRFSKAFLAWNLPTFQWTFIVGCDGRVLKRFQGFVGFEELANELDKLLTKYESETLCIT